jgi:hypothetical protein
MVTQITSLHRAKGMVSLYATTQHEIIAGQLDYVYSDHNMMTEKLGRTIRFWQAASDIRQMILLLRQMIRTKCYLSPLHLQLNYVKTFGNICMYLGCTFRSGRVPDQHDT